MPRSRTPRNRRTGNAGVGLIEVLIAVLVMAIGLLGIAALQATALRNSQSALERSQAVIHSYAILDAMRANLDLARAGAYNMGMTCTAPAADPDATPTLGSNDKAAWITSLQNLSATACGQISCVAVGGSLAKDCTVIVQWDDSRGGVSGEVEATAADEATHQVQTETRI